METIEQRDKRRNNNYHSLSEIEAAGNVIVSISERNGTLLTKRGNVYTSYLIQKVNGVIYWKPTSAHQ